jgi:hypothetical protein
MFDKKVIFLILAYDSAGGNDMKKILIVILIVIASIFTCIPHLKAEETEQVLYVNLLDLRNLTIESNGLSSVTKSPIVLETGKKYTIALSYDFLGRNQFLKDEYYIEMMFHHAGILYDIIATNDQQNERLYLEFVAPSSMMDFYVFPIDVLNPCYDVILYQGDYVDFNGFIPYLYEHEVMDYYGALPMDYDDLLTLNQIKALIVAKDPFGNPIEVNLEFDNYSNSNQYPNLYQMIFSAMYLNIVKYYHLDIRIFDLTAPLIIVPEWIEVDLGRKRTIESLLEEVLISDNVDVLHHSDLVIVDDQYTSKNDIGPASITVSISDSSGNITIETLNIMLIDIEGPSISGSKAIYIYTTDIPLSHTDILNKYEVYDRVDKHNTTKTITVDQYLGSTLPGIYDVRITGYDTKMNATHYDIKIHVVEHRGPIFETDDKILIIDIHNPLNETEIKNWFIDQMQNLGYQVSMVKVLHNEYEIADKKAGNYYVYLSYDIEEETYLTRLLIQVNEVENQGLHYMYYVGISLLTLGFLTVIYLKKKKII